MYFQQNTAARSPQNPSKANCLAVSAVKSHGSIVRTCATRNLEETQKQLTTDPKYTCSDSETAASRIDDASIRLSVCLSVCRQNAKKRDFFKNSAI